MYSKSNGSAAENEMLKTFNCGVGLVIVVEPNEETVITKTISKFHKCYTIGEIAANAPVVMFDNNLDW